MNKKAQGRNEILIDATPEQVVERCTEVEHGTRISFVVERDTFGFSKMFDDFGFSFLLEPRDHQGTHVALEGFYREKNVLAHLMNALIMKRKLHHLRAGILTNLKATVDAQTSDE